MAPGSVAVLPAASEQIRNRDSEYPFRQDSDFYYLTGFTEPDALLVLAPGRRGERCVAFCRPRDPAAEVWTGYRVGPEGLQERYGCDRAWPIEELDQRMPSLLAGASRIYYSLGRHGGLDGQMLEWLRAVRSGARTGAGAPSEIVDLDPLLHAQRNVKSAAELRLMRRAGQLTAEAHCRAMRACRPGLFEYELEAELLHAFMRGGARSPAYSSIVGAGANACIMHYVENRSRLEDGDLVLIDAGAELEHYAADVTRTFPANGRFSEPQRLLYEVVLRAQRAAIAKVAPGRDWNAPHAAAVEEITRGLIDLGLLKGRFRTLVEKEAYRPFFLHSTGHWLGLDVHDVGEYRSGGRWRRLEAGMVLTVEPGIYVAPDNRQVAAKWRGIGIRIEDDVAVTDTGNEVLTDAAPKTVDAIEALMASER
jgi:Xaa-Pro aminopeptidase